MDVDTKLESAFRDILVTFAVFFASAIDSIAHDVGQGERGD